MQQLGPILVSLIVGLGGAGGIGALLKVRSDKNQLAAGTKKIQAEAADILADSAVALLGPFREEIDRLRVELKEVKEQSKELEQTLARERATSDTRIRQLESDIATRDRKIIELSQSPQF